MCRDTCTWSVPAWCNPHHDIVLQMRARTTSSVTGFAPPARPAGLVPRECNLKPDAGEPFVWRTKSAFDKRYGARARYSSLMSGTSPRLQWVGVQHIRTTRVLLVPTRTHSKQRLPTTTRGCAVTPSCRTTCEYLNAVNAVARLIK